MTTASPTFDIIGKRYRIDAYPFAVEISYESETKVTVKVLDGGGLAETGYSETMSTRLMELRNKVFMSAVKTGSGATATLIADFELGVAYINITTPSADFYTLQASLLPVVP